MILLQKGFAMGKLDILNLFKYLILYFAAQREFERERKEYMWEKKMERENPLFLVSVFFLSVSSDSSRNR